MSVNIVELYKNGVGVGIGAAIMFYAAEVYHWYGYMKANPAVGEVFTTTGFTVFYFVVFIIGTIIAYTFFMQGLASILTTTTDE